MPTLHILKNPCITLQLALHLHGSASMDSTNSEICSAIVHSERNPCVSGSAPSKSVLFKGQLYKIMSSVNKDNFILPFRYGCLLFLFFNLR